jgi:hypothetical protein
VLQVLQDVQTGIVSTNGTTLVTTNCSQAITPASASNTVLVTVTLNGCATTDGQKPMNFKLFRGATQIADMSDSNFYTPVTTSYASGGTIGVTYLDSPATTSSTTYEVKFAATTATTVYIGNYQNNNTVTSSITLMEIGA